MSRGRRRRLAGLCIGTLALALFARAQWIFDEMDASPSIWPDDERPIPANPVFLIESWDEQFLNLSNGDVVLAAGGDIVPLLVLERYRSPWGVQLLLAPVETLVPDHEYVLKLSEDQASYYESWQETVTFRTGVRDDDPPSVNSPLRYDGEQSILVAEVEPGLNVLARVSVRETGREGDQTYLAGSYFGIVELPPWLGLRSGPDYQAIVVYFDAAGNESTPLETTFSISAKPGEAQPTAEAAATTSGSR